MKTDNYEVRIMRSSDLTPEIMRYVYDSGKALHELYEEFKFKDWKHFHFKAFADHKDGLFLMCFRNGKPVGAMMGVFKRSFFDPNIVFLQQNLLVAEPKTRASVLLIKKFIDLGQETANHVICCIGQKTNIKATSLEKLGFVQMETMFRLEKQHDGNSG